MKQKLASLLPVLVLVICCSLSSIHVAQALPADPASGGGDECLISSIQGKAVNPPNIISCDTAMKGGKDGAGVAYSTSKCYDLYQHNGSTFINKEISCSDKRFSAGGKCPSGYTGTPPDCSIPQVTCPDGSVAPNGSVSSCPVNIGTGACPTGVEKTCNVNSATSCSSKGDTISNCTDPAAASNAKCTASNCNLVTKYVNPLVQLLSAAVGIIVTISIIIGGIQYSTSAGDPAKVSAAKNRIRNSLIAFVAFLFLYAFLQFLVPGGIFNR